MTSKMAQSSNIFADKFYTAIKSIIEVKHVKATDERIFNVLKKDDNDLDLTIFKLKPW